MANMTIEIEWTASWNCPNPKCNQYTYDHDEGVEDDVDTFHVVCEGCNYEYSVDKD